MKTALIRAGKVVHVVRGDPATAARVFGTDYDAYVDVSNLTVAAGDTYDGTTFTPGTAPPAIPASVRFVSYVVEDAGTVLTFERIDADQKYVILLTDAELAGVSTAAALRTLVTTKLNRKIKAALVATKLDAFIGQTVTL